MIIEFLTAAGLIVMTVTVHSAGLSLLIRGLAWSHALGKSGFWFVTSVVVCLTCWLLLVHLVEVLLWGVFYFWQGCIPDIRSALFFSGGAYTTVGYSGVTMPEQWQMLALLETLTGILMVGLSTGLFFALVSNWVNRLMQMKAKVD